jgi:hypothetical protein
MVAAYEGETYWDGFIAEPLPTAFTDWLIDSNNTGVTRQLQTAQHIISYIKGSPPDLPTYDIAKFLILWNLPDTPRTKKNSRIVL